MINGGADHCLATGKALPLQAVQGLPSLSRLAQHSGGTQQFFLIVAQGVIGLSSSKSNPSKVLFFSMITPRGKNTVLKKYIPLYLFLFGGGRVPQTPPAEYIISHQMSWYPLTLGASPSPSLDRGRGCRLQTAPSWPRIENASNTFACIGPRWLARNR